MTCCLYSSAPRTSPVFNCLMTQRGSRSTEKQIPPRYCARCSTASLSRRGLFHDGEINSFTVPEGLKAGADNPVRDLRLRLWAEMLDLPETLAAPLLADPVAATALFDRSPLLGNRYTDLGAYPEHVMFGLNGGDGIVSTVLELCVGVPAAAVEHRRLFDGVVDPTSALESG